MFNTINCIYNYILLSFTTNLNFIRYVCSKRGDNLLKRYVLIFALILLTVNAAAKQESTYRSKVLPDLKEKTESSVKADSIMKEVIKNAEKYQHVLSKYEAEIYIKGRTEILKQNFLMRFAHHLFPVDRKNKDMIFEMVSKSKFNAPNNFLHNFQAVNGNSIPNNKKQQEALSFLNLNVYSSTIYNEGIITPMTNQASKFYTFDLESVSDTSGLRIYKIRFMPKLWSQKLICGDLYIRDQSWIIDKIDVNGRFDFAEFNLIMTFGRDYRRFILPDKASLYLRYHVLGNAIATSYHSSFKYKAVEWVEEDNETQRKRSLDLTGYYKLSSDTVPIISDTTFWNKERDIPLTKEEERLYHVANNTNEQKIDSANITKYLKLTEKFTNTISMDYKTTRLKYSGIFNPFQLGYSGHNGITYRQRLRISKTFDKDRQLRFRPDVGFVFKRKEIFFTVSGDWEYLPEKKGILSLSVGNGNQSYSSAIMKEINEQLKDSTFNFDDLNLEYFKHYYAEIRNNIELFNGFQLWTGVSYHRRIPVKKKSDISNPGEGIEEIINDNYHDFTPVVGFSYTPRQYYWMDGYRKEYLYSYYPTISVEFAREIPGVGKSSGDYGRIEADIHQSIALGLSRKLNYHISGGIYLNPKSIYFADFRYFSRRQFPESWGDEFGGVFNQLRSFWFNASDKYVQGHIMYESPFILSQLFKKKTSKYILSERFYFSHLWTPVLPSYTEVGYGFGNHIFNVAAFAGFDRWKYQNIGLKFAFELF